MTEQEREELIEKMARALAQSHVNGLVYQDAARAALAVAEPVIREECAKIAASHNGCEISISEGQWCEAVDEIAAAIREGATDE